jgi:hypothetical protein
MARKVVVIETAATTFTALEISGGAGSPEVRRLASERLPADGLTDAWLKQLWQQRQFSTTRVIWLAPEALVRYKTLTFMMLPEEQLAAAVQVELESSGGEAPLWRIIGTQLQGDQVRVRVALIAADQLTQALVTLKQAGLEVLWSGFYWRGLQNFSFFHQDLWETATSRYAYLYLHEDQAEYGVVSETNLFYQRRIKLGNLVLTGAGADTAFTDLLEEVRLSVAAAKSGGQPTADRLWLFGAEEAVLVNVQKTLAKVGLQTVYPAKTHLAGVTLPNIPRLAPLIGLALDELGWNTQKKLRLYTKEQQQRQITRGQINWVLKFAIAGGFLLLGGWLLAQAKLSERQKQQQWLLRQTDKLIRLQRAEAGARVNLSKIRSLERWSGQKGRELEFLRALQRCLAKDTLITDLTIEEGRVKNLAGLTPSVSLLLTKLEADANPVLNRLQLKGNIMKTESGYELFQLEEKDDLKAAQP